MRDGISLSHEHASIHIYIYSTVLWSTLSCYSDSSCTRIGTDQTEDPAVAITLE
ncbi:uncharacterized protein BO97DRAFT_287121 [Aspergillus homomorphus CBS 101889]|uniref:Uncharacterized protein n=1 Tax=Aspergillus homomorphus (strain CBS 101889) TaxID=1450537 RepID=A0A395HGT7_ASPHC|nr:hypothetical protein BO97DRAFT_287121 [Aspergillus homomorphus CBS 101889]RAL06709.1 hypothetical protein BO97DRAFT_287121 [Aspergillus homomorphus CBS 101889]